MTATRRPRVSQVALWLCAGIAVGIAAMAACGGPMTMADAGNGTDAGGGACCNVMVTGPIEIQQPISVTVDDTTPIDVSITNTVPVEVTLPTPLTVVVARPTFKGVTTAVFDGGGGWATMNASCDLSFPGSRVCSDRELMTNYPAPVPGVDAWMVMTPVGGDGSAGALPPWGGSSAGCCNVSVNCSSGAGIFNTASGGGAYILTATGNFDSTNCAFAHPAACCGY